jgi:hypothetical protein
MSTGGLHPGQLPRVVRMERALCVVIFFIRNYGDEQIRGRHLGCVMAHQRKRLSLYFKNYRAKNGASNSTTL